MAATEVKDEVVGDAQKDAKREAYRKANGATRNIRRDRARKTMGLPNFQNDDEFKKLMATTKMATSTAAARPLLTIYSLEGKTTKRRIQLPDVMLTPIRADLVNFVHTNMSKNKRQPYAVLNQEGPHGLRAGMQVAAKSWGTGRAVSRVPRVKGGGTHRAGQGAYGMMTVSNTLYFADSLKSL